MNTIVLLLLVHKATTFETGWQSAETPVVIKPGVRDYTDLFNLEVQSFTEMVKKNKVFVDNTLFIKECLNSSHPMYMIAPEKSGRTINLDMLKTFLEIQVDDQGDPITPKNTTSNYRLFVNGEITMDDGTIQKLDDSLLISKRENAIKYWLGAYPVVYVNFKDVRGDNFQEIQRSLAQALVPAFRQHKYLLNAFQKSAAGSARSRNELTWFSTILNNEQTKIGTFQNDILELCRILRRHFRRLPIIIYDDFDKCITNILQSPRFPDKGVGKALFMLGEIFQNTISHHQKLRKAFVIGSFHLLTLTSDVLLEYYDYIDLLTPEHSASLGRYFVFDKQTVDYLFGLNELPDELRARAYKWYEAPNAHTFNIYSITHFLHNKEITVYWNDRDTERIVSPLIKACGNLRAFILDWLNKLPLPDYRPTQEGIAEDTSMMSRLRPCQTLNISTCADLAGDFELLLLRKGYLRMEHKSSLYYTGDPIVFTLANTQTAASMCCWLISHYQREYDIEEGALYEAATALRRFVDNENSAIPPLERALGQIYNRSSPHLVLPDWHGGDKQTFTIGIEDPFYAVFACVVLKMQNITRFQVDAVHPKFGKYVRKLQIHDGLFVDLSYVISNSQGQFVILQLNYNQTIEYTFASIDRYKSNAFVQLNNTHTVRSVVMKINADNTIKLHVRLDE